MEDLEYPMEDPHQPTVTEELLQIVEEFADYIDKFMFEIVTFLAVVDSSMGLIKDVLAVFGFGGWKMTFFPSFSFVVTVAVFLFGTNKRKGKRKAEAAQLEGLGEAMEMLDDVFEVMDDVMDEIEEVEGESGGLGLGDYSDSEDDDDDDQNTCKTESNAGETSITGDAGEIDVVSGDDNQETTQQDVKPPKSSLRKAIGMAIIVARIAAKLAKKRQQAQEDSQQQENADNLETSEECATVNETGGETLTGTDVPPTDNKSKINSDTRNQSETEGLTLEEAGRELRNEASDLVEAVKEDSIKAAELVKEGSLGASNIVQGNTKQVLASTGALKVGHGLYREADFITGRVNKEVKTAAKTVGKETVEKTRQLKDNNIVKATGVEKVSVGASREASFIGSHLNHEAKKVVRCEDQTSGINLTSNASQSKTTEGKGGQTSSCQSKEEGKSRTAIQNVGQPSKNVSTAEATRQKRETKGNINTVSETGKPKQQTSKQTQSSESKFPKKDLLTYVGSSENIPEDLQPSSEIKINHEDNVKEGENNVDKQTCESIELGLLDSKQDSNQDPEHISREPVPGVPDMASNVTEGVSGAAGAAGAAASQAKNLDGKAKEGLQQTQKKSKGILQIAMRLVRLIMRVANKRGNSAANSQSSSRMGSTSSGAGPLGGPAKGKRTADGGDGSAANMADAAPSMAMGSAAPKKGGKIGAIVGIVVRLVRLASKLKGGQKAPPTSDMRTSKDSIDLVSDSEFYDCGEDFPTSEIQTQTEDKLSLLSVATQTTYDDPGSTWTMTTRDAADITDMRIDESSNEELMSLAHAFQATAGQNNDSSCSSQAIQPDGIKQSNSFSNADDPTSSSREQKANVFEGLKGDVREGTTKQISMRSPQIITLKISSPNIDQSSSGATNTDLNSILLDIDAPVVLHSTREVRTSMNDDVNAVANDNNSGVSKRQNVDFERPRTEHRNECSPRYDNLLRNSAGDLNELEKQTQPSRLSGPRNVYPNRRVSSDGDLSTIRYTGLTRGTIVPYSSSSEDLDESASFVSRRRPTVVRFEDECAGSHAYDEDEPVTSYRDKKKRNVPNRQKYDQTRPTDTKKYSNLEKERAKYRYSGEKEVDDDPSAIRDSGYAYEMSDESERLLSEYGNQMVQPSNTISVARKSKLSGSRSSYFGDDESDHTEALC